MQNMLFWLFVTPLLSSFALGFIPGQGAFLKRTAAFLSALPLIILVSNHSEWLGYEFATAWFPSLGINFYLHIDEISLLFLYLCALITPLSILCVDPLKTEHQKSLYFLILVLQSFVIIFFSTRDLAVFTVFWEAMLLPLYFIILIWGKKERQKAALKFLVYMIAGSVLMIAAVIALYVQSVSAFGEGTFDLETLALMTTRLPMAPWIIIAFLLAFAVKSPLFPFHAWLPDAYCEAPTSGTILLAALLSKAGIYGFLRIGLGLFPQFMQEWSLFLLLFAVVGVFYGAFAAWQQSDFKRAIAYSSFSHVNFVLIALFTWQQTSHIGAILQALNHGITIAALFLVASWVEERLASSTIPSQGIGSLFPRLCWISVFFAAAAVALPGTNNFVGEFLILLGLFAVNPWICAVLALSVVFSAVYMLRLLRKIYFGPQMQKLPADDINRSQFCVALGLASLILILGIYPQVALSYIKPAAQKIALESGTALNDKKAS